MVAYPQATYPYPPPPGWPGSPWPQAQVPSWAAPAPVAPQEEPTWLEVVSGTRMPRGRPGGRWGAPMALGEAVRVRVRDGHRVVAQELRRDQWLISVVPDEAVRGGVGIAPLVVPLATSALKSVVSLVQNIVDAAKKGKEAKEAKAASPPALPGPTPAPAAPAPGDVGCEGRCTCRGRR